MYYYIELKYYIVTPFFLSPVLNLRHTFVRLGNDLLKNVTINISEIFY